MKDWWDSLQAKERLVAAAGIIVVAIAIFYLAIWSPIAGSRDNKKMRVENKRETLVWMTQKRQEVEHLKRINPNLFNQATDKRSLLTIVDTGAKQMGIRSSITNISPKGDDKVQIALEDMVFDRLIVLLGELNRRNHILVTGTTLTKSDQIGKVTGSVALTK